jgi:hypothetical protein
MTDNSSSSNVTPAITGAVSDLDVVGILDLTGVIQLG